MSGPVSQDATSGRSLVLPCLLLVLLAACSLLALAMDLIGAWFVG